MFKRLLLIICGVVVLAGCAKLPVEDLEETRRIVAYAYASGASRLAPEEYRVASEALQGAEKMVKQGDYRQAEQGLLRARKFSTQALSQTILQKQLYAEQQVLAAKKAREAAERKAEVARKQQVVEKEVVRIAPLVVPAPVAKPELVLVDQVVVVEGETLGSISARKEVFGDLLLWPLIYKANRDQIKDPQVIFSGQILLIPRDKTEGEQSAARQEALELNLF